MNHGSFVRCLGAPLLLVALAACGKEKQLPVYQAVPVARRDIVVSARAAGTIQPITTVDVKSKAQGEITAVYVDVGDSVRTGQSLIRVDPRVPANALRQAEANLEVAKAQLTNASAQFKRAEELHKTQAITDQDYETARLNQASANAQLVAAQRNVEDAKISFEDTDVKAPSNGIILTRNVEKGTVISSATSNVGGGTVLLQMAKLDTVQVQGLVDETDIGKIAPGMPVTISVDAYPNRQFNGRVLKIQPQATVNQNVTMFPVIVQIPNPGTLLKPGMNTEIEVHIGSRQNVLAIPNAALRTQRDVGSAAAVLGVDIKTVQEELASARQKAAADSGGQASMGGNTATEKAADGGEKMTTPSGREITLPAGVTAKEVNAIFEKMRGGNFASLTADERAIMQKLRSAGGFGGGARGAGGNGENGPSGGGAHAASEYLFGGNYIVFVMRNGKPTALPVRTGLTDLDYSEVMNGLTEQDTVLILPSASLVQSQQEFQNRMQRMQQNSPVPGVGGGRR